MPHKPNAPLSTENTLPTGLVVWERGWLSSNGILFVGNDTCALVDSGYVTHSAQTVALAHEALGDRPLDHLLNTHLHSDHCGGNAALQKAYPELKTWIPPGDAPLVARWDEEALSFHATGQDCPSFRFDQLLEPGSEMRLGNLPWQIHAAPGHDPHAVLLFEPASRTLISADALWETGFGVVFPELRGEPSFAEVAATLDLIERLEPRRVIPGHGRVFGDAPKALAVARNRLDRLAQDPRKHAWHAAKVLLKFKLLEAQELEGPALARWVVGTPYVELIRRRFFPELTQAGLVAGLQAELIERGAARQVGDQLHNA